MRCPACLSVVPEHDERAAEARCPVCGGVLQWETREDVAMTADGTDEQGWDGRALVGEARVEQVERALMIRRQPEAEAPVTVFERMTALPALAWRQPAVRSIVRTGAGAVALTLLARAARRWLDGSQRGRAAAAGERLLPALADALGAPDRRPRAPREPGHPPDDGALVVETFIYARRVIRR
jgi:hypothetical protein